jgi:hypothetical protein
MPTVAEIDPIAEMLRLVAAGAPVARGAVTVVSLLLVTPPEDSDRLAPAASGMHVARAGAPAGVTGELDGPLLLVEGEELTGPGRSRRPGSAQASPLDEIPAGPGQVGALVYASGRWVGVEILRAPCLFARAWPRLRSRYAAAEIGGPAAARLTPSPGAVLLRLAACPIEPVGVGDPGGAYRLSGLRTAGAALVAGNRLAHLTAFPRPAAVAAAY